MTLSTTYIAVCLVSAAMFLRCVSGISTVHSSCSFCPSTDVHDTLAALLMHGYVRLGN